MSRLDSFDFDSPLWELPAQSPAFPAFAASGVAGSSVDPTSNSSSNVAAATPSTHPYATSAGAQPPPTWAMDASAHAWLGGANPVAATTAPTSSVSTLARPAPLAAQNGSGPQGAYLSQMPLPNMAIPAGARVTTGTASSSTSTAAEAAAATLAASSSSTDTSRLQQASDALRALMADHAPASLGHALAAAGQPGGALAPGQQQQQQPAHAHTARAPNAGIPASTSAPSSSSAAAAHQSPFANISADTYAALINQANSTLYGSQQQQQQQSQLGGTGLDTTASMASTSAAAAAALAAAAQYGMPMQLNLRQPPPPLGGAAARGSASPFPPNVAMQFAAGVGAAPGGPVASPALPQYAFSAADLRAQQQQQQGSPLVAAGLAQQQQQQQRFQSHQPPQQQRQQGASEVKPAEEQRMVNGNGNGSSSASTPLSGGQVSVEQGQQGNRSPTGNSQAASANGAPSALAAPAPLTVSTSTSGPDASTSASVVKTEATPGYSPDDPYIPSLGRGSSNPRSATAHVTYHEDSPPELSCPSDDSADEDFGKQQRSSKGGRKSSTGAGGTAAAAGGRGRQKTRRAAAVAAASGLGVGASKAGGEVGSVGEAASTEFAPAVAGGSVGILDPAIEGGVQPGGSASRDSSTDGKPTLTNRKRASPATTPGAIDPVTGFMRRTTEIPAVEDDPSIRPYGCNWCFVERKEAERIARRQRRAAAAVAAAPLDGGLSAPQPVVMPNLEEASGSSASQLHAYQHHLQQQQQQQQQQSQPLMQTGEASTSGHGVAGPSSSLPVQPASSFAHSVPVAGQSSPSAVAKGKARARDAMTTDGADEDADGETDPEDDDQLGASNVDAATTTGGAGAGISDSDDEEALNVVANDPNLPAIQWRTVKELREHMSKDHKDRPIKSRKEEDETTGPLDMPFRCALIPCDKTFKSLAGLRFHFQNASTNGHFTVSVELDAETGEERATKRFKQDAKPSGRELKCPIPRCPKRFKQSAGLAYHLSHTPNHTVSEAMLETFEATLASKTKWWYNRLGKSFAQE
ncbi:hypothetical protein RHOSPDRAFT_26715 [Rhodotorula sp. JG-1b]|nr:hypothetical protein RHOSPDRAFT_26715 [Rhodotorula sp. JG-1b]